MTQELQTEPAHHQHSPSTLKWKAVCPGWTSDQTGDMTAADDGTIMHEAYETGNLNGLSEEHAGLVRQAIGFTDELERGADQVLREFRMQVLGGRTRGTADRVIIRGTHAIVFDLKTGYGYIDHPKENKQSHSYVAGVFEAHPFLETIEAIFYVPRRDEVLRHTWVRAKDWDYLAAVLTAVLTGAESHTEADLVPTEEGCFYCARRGMGCPALTSKMMVLAKKYEELEIVENVHSSALTDPNKMAQLLTIAKVAERFADSVKHHANQMALGGTPIPGYSLRERAGKRKITSPAAALNIAMRLSEQFGLGLEPVDIVGHCDMPIGELETVLTERADSREDRERILGAMNTALMEADAVEEGSPIVYLQKNRNRN